MTAGTVETLVAAVAARVTAPFTTATVGTDHDAVAIVPASSVPLAETVTVGEPVISAAPVKEEAGTVTVIVSADAMS